MWVRVHVRSCAGVCVRLVWLCEYCFRVCVSACVWLCDACAWMRGIFCVCVWGCLRACESVLVRAHWYVRMHVRVCLHIYVCTHVCLLAKKSILVR